MPSVEFEAYLAGLLHDLGVLEMYEAHGKPYSEAVTRCQREQIPLIGLEADAFGETHGQRLLARAGDWHFPELLTQAIGYHDAPQEAPEASRGLAMVVRAAHIVVAEPCKGWSDMPPSPEDDQVLRDLGLQPDDMVDIRALMQERMKEVVSVLR